MRRLILNLFIILSITAAYSKIGSVTQYIRVDMKSEKSITPMEALDLIQERYAANFDKIEKENTDDNYYYKLASADYYLAYEGEVGEEKDYLIHLYEFVIDDPETGVGHTVTYGWYTVDRLTGIITDNTY